MISQTENRVCVVTGGANGIGRGLVEEGLSRGMRVVATDIESASLERLSEEVDAGDRLVTTVTDVRDPDQVDALADFSYSSFGAVHLLFNNAGVMSNGALWDEPAQVLAWEVGVNLLGPMHGIRSFVPRMLAGGEEGLVVNAGSLASFRAARGLGTYSATKHAVLGLTEGLYFDLLASGSPVSAALMCAGGVQSTIAKVNRAPGGLDIARDEAINRANVDDEWMSAAEAARVVFDGILVGRFWLFTHPDRRGAGQVRQDAMMRDEPPPMRELAVAATPVPPERDSG